VSFIDSALGCEGSSRRRIAVAVSLALASAASQVHAQSAEEPKTLPKVSVQAAEEEVTPKVDRVSSPKFTQPLLDTPQTISIVSSAVLNQQGATSLSQALRNTPGVTFLLGENGNTATGDSIFMRGFDTQGSIFIDGIRDLGSVTRDTFNTEQVEIAKGPAGPDYGRSAASGYVNLASKVPTTRDFTGGSASYGTSDNARLTGDINHRFEGTGTALRLNVMGQDGEVEGRDYIERKGWAIAPALAFGLDTDTRSYFYLLHTEQDNVPDGGVTTLGLDGFYNRNFDPNPLPVTPPAAPTAPGVVPAAVDRENFYGYRSDFEEISGTMFTARFEHDFSDNVTLRNSTRFGRLKQFYVLTGVNALNVPDPNPASWTVNRSRQAKFQENKLLTNQTNLTINVETGAVRHAITSGIEFISEEQFAPTYVGLGTLVPVNPYNPDLPDAPPDYAPVRNGVFARGETQTIGAYLFDTLSFGEKWQVTGGARADQFDTNFDGASLVGTAPNQVLTPLHLSLDDTLFSYKAGVMFKPVPNGSIYLSHATSQQPPGGANFTLAAGGTGNSVNRVDLEPTEGSNLELGSKWEFNDGAFIVTAALFDSSNKNELIADPVTPNTFIQVGEREVKGLELGFVGKLSDNWDLTAGFAKMNTDITRGTATQQGAAINWSPELTFSSWTTYRAPFGLTIGGGVRYTDTVARSVTNQPVDKANTPSAPEYWVIDAMLGYQINEQISLQLNGYNLADEEYIGTLNNGGSRYIPGTPRSALLTVNFTF
jgi:catecholate siderophore receptor